MEPAVSPEAGDPSQSRACSWLMAIAQAAMQPGTQPGSHAALYLPLGKNAYVNQKQNEYKSLVIVIETH